MPKGAKNPQNASVNVISERLVGEKRFRQIIVRITYVSVTGKLNKIHSWFYNIDQRGNKFTRVYMDFREFISHLNKALTGPV